jgi:kynurenine formamidase
MEAVMKRLANVTAVVGILVGCLALALQAQDLLQIESRLALVRPNAGTVPQQQEKLSSVSKEQFDRWMTGLSNWGRWGKDDQLGAANLITPAKRREAAALVKSGTTVSLARVLTAKPLAEAPAEISYGWLGGRFQLFPKDDWVLERRAFDYHGGEFTHVDALCHVAYQGKLYNGFTFSEVVTSNGGCSKLGIAALKDGVVTRGLLLDIPGKSVGPEDIRAWEKRTGLKLASGDAIFLRTRRAGDTAHQGGYDPSLMPLLKERDVALIGSDVAQEGDGVPGVSLAFHRFALVALGAHLIDNMDLEALAATAGKLNRWEFLFMATSPAITNGAGAPINPTAVF